jgi:hypothetical protein
MYVEKYVKAILFLIVRSIFVCSFWMKLDPLFGGKKCPKIVLSEMVIDVQNLLQILELPDRDSVQRAERS